MKKVIYYHDTDAGGVVYYANYLKYLEEARSEFFSQAGVSLKDLSRQGVWFVVARVEVNYRHPAFYADVLEVENKIAEITAVRIVFLQKIIREPATLICEAKTTLVCVDQSFKPRAIPLEVARSLAEKK